MAVDDGARSASKFALLWSAVACQFSSMRGRSAANNYHHTRRQVAFVIVASRLPHMLGSSSIELTVVCDAVHRGRGAPATG